jgi:predicted ABC-type ATPase
MERFMKTIHLVLGAIASGKSSISEKVLSQDASIEYVCADTYKTKFFDVPVAGENASKVGYRCADELLFYRIEDLCSQGKDFVLEFCPTNRNKFETIKYYARLYEYTIISYFVGTDDVKINLSRSKKREKDGGDYVSEQKIKIRYEDAYNSILEIMCISKRVYFIDNSEEKLTVVALLNKKTFTVYNPGCHWFKTRVQEKITKQRG